MPLLNPYLRAFFRSALPAQCTPVEDYILLVPTTEILTTARDRETGALYSDLAGVDEFLGSHVLRVPNGAASSQTVGGRENRGKARQFTTFNGRTVVVKDSWVYSNKGFRNLNQAQLLNDTLYYPDVADPHQWLVYFITKPLIGSLEYVPTIPPYFRDRSKPEGSDSASGNSAKKNVRSFNELLMLFPMIARQMQPGLEKLFLDFEVSFEKFKPLPLPPPSPSSARSINSVSSSRASSHSSVNGDIYKQAADESEIRRSLEAAINAAVDLFQRVDQAQLDLLASSTDLTGPAVDRLIERYVAEQLHDTTLFPRLCATQAIEDEELERKILDMENVDLSQVGIPSLDQQEKKSLVRRITRGISSFEKIGTSKSPQAMVEHLLETARTLTRDDEIDASDAALRNPEKSTIVTMNADMLVSLLLIVVIRSKVPSLHACLSYMRNFVFAEDVEQGETGYVLSTLEAVLFHIAQDRALCAASSMNEKLWRNVKEGNLEAVRRYLDRRKEDDEEEEERDEDEKGDHVSQNRNLTRASEEVLPRKVVENEVTLVEHKPSEDALVTHEIANEAVSVELGESSYQNGTLEKAEVNGVEEQVVEGVDEPPRGRSRHASNESLKLKQSLPNGVVHISDAAPEKIPIKEPEKELRLEVGSEDEPTNGDPSSLALEGPPPEDVFTEPASPSTGISSVRVEELQSDENDADISTNEQVQVPSTQKPLPPNPRPGVARFEVEVTRSSSRFSRKKENRRSTSVTSLATTLSDASFTSFISRTQSQTNDSVSVEKLSKTRNSLGESILMMAIQERQAETLDYLLNTEFFDVDFVLEDADNQGTTLLSAAVQVEDVFSVNILLKLLLQQSSPVLRKYFEKADNAGRTVAHYLFNTPDLISRIGKWMPWRCRDKNGQTPLFALCRSYDHTRYREMVAMAVKSAQQAQGDGSRLHLDEHVDSKGNTLLHIAGDPAVLKSLLRCDSDVNAMNEKGFTALMVASKYGRIEMVKTLFNDPRVDVLAKELRGLTAVELAKDDDVRNRIDDLVLFQNAPGDDGRVTAIVRSFFVEDATVRVVLKSGAPAADSSATFMVVTCRRSLADFEFLANWLQYENPASWLPTLPGARSPYQIPSKPSRSVLRDIQLRLDNFLRTLLAHPTFSTHELLWEFFLVPEIQPDLMIERSKKKAEARVERVREDFTPVEDVREVEMFVSYAKDSVRSINISVRSVTRRATVIHTCLADLADTHKQVIRHLAGFKFLTDSPQLAAYTRLVETTLIPSESHPYNLFIESFRDIQSSLVGVLAALDRPKRIIEDMSQMQKQIDRQMVSLRRSDRWPLGLLDDTRTKIQKEAKEKALRTEQERLGKAAELRFAQAIAAQELAAFHEMHAKKARQAIRELVRRQVVAEKDRLDGMRRALRGLRNIRAEAKR